MKKSLIALAMLMAIPVAAMAFGGPGPGMRGGPNVEYMASVLDLTPDQQAKVKALFEEKAKQRAEMRAVMQAETQAKMQEILTKDQFAKMTELRQFRHGGQGAGMGGRGPGMGGCNGTGPRGAQ